MDVINYIRSRRIMPQGLLPNKNLYFKKVGNIMYFRTPFNNTYDLVQIWYADKSVTSDAYTNNPIVEPYRTYLLDKTTALSAAWDSGTLYHDTSDDICPLQYNGTYIGGNHGANVVQNLVVTSHDKDNSDLGSQWAIAGVTWTLIRVVDVNNLCVLADFTTDGTNGYWTGNTAIGASPATHISGATHTANIVYTSTALSQLIPALKNVTLEILIDGMITNVDSTIYQAAFVDIIQSYDVCDPRTILAYMKANIGKNLANAVADASVTADVTVTSRYRIKPNGCCELKYQIDTKNYLNAANFNGIQSGPMDTTGGRKLLVYVPRTKPLSGVDLRAVADITGGVASLLYYNGSWQNTQYPPFRFTQLLRDASDNPLIGFTMGYSLSKLDSVDSLRKYVSAAYNLNTTKKHYPYDIRSTAIPGGQTKKVLAFRQYFDPSNINGATVYEYHEEGNELIVDIDFHTNVSNLALPIPSGGYGKTVSTLHSDGNITINTTTVTGAGIVVSVAGGYGSATLKIS